MENKGLDWETILKKMAAFSSCFQSKNKILETEPYAHMSMAQKNMDMIESFKTIFLENGNKRVLLEGMENLDSILYSIKKGQSLNILDLNTMRVFFEDLKALNELYAWTDYENLYSLIERVLKPDSFLEKINKLITDSGEFRSDASYLLYESFNKKNSLSKQVHKTLDRIVKDFSMENTLQDKYVTTREGRWVLPVISGRQHDLKGIIHDSSNSKQTVFMEPEEVVGLNNKIRELEEIIRREIERLLKEISDYLSEKHPEISKSYEAAIEIDALSAVAMWALTFDAKRIMITKDPVLNLKETFHPLLIEETENLTKNDFELSHDENVLLLSGPNAGGKTVFLKCIGLACHMARCGFPVCAHESSTVPFFTEIKVLIGDHQSVEDSLSTFAAHLKALDECSLMKGPKNLILIDEICGSTEAGEGSALARAFIEKISQNNVKGFVTSHLGPLKAGWDETSGVVNGSMFFDQKKGTPTYEFVKGIPGDSLALETAKKVGVHKDIIDRALFFLDPEQRKKYAGLVEIESLQDNLKKQRDLYKSKQTELDDLKKEYQGMIKDFKDEQDSLLELSIKKAQANLDQNSGYANIQKFLKNKKHIDAMKESSPNLIKTSSEKPSSEITEENFAKKFPPGTPVYIPSLKKKGVIQGTPNAKGFVPVMSDSMRLLIKWSDARSAALPDPGEQKRKMGSVKKVIEGKTENQVDLRGMDVESALQELEDAIDQSLRLECERLKVVHGHGTEKIKKNVRSFLSRHPLVKTWKADQNDGATQAIF